MKELRFAFRQSIPVLCGYLFLGLAFGLALEQAGYGLPWAFASSVFVYAGSLQFVLVDLLRSGAGLVATAVMSLSVNSRHLFYGLSFLDTFRDMGKYRPYMIFSLTDETYSILCGVQVPPALNKTRVLFFLSLLDHLYWISGSVLGSVAGALIPFDFTGVDFAMTALFLVIFVEQWCSSKSHYPALLGAGCGLVCLLVFGSGSFLLPAMAAAAAGLLANPRAGTLPAETVKTPGGAA